MTRFSSHEDNTNAICFYRIFFITTTPAHARYSIIRGRIGFYDLTKLKGITSRLRLVWGITRLSFILSWRNLVGVSIVSVSGIVRCLFSGRVYSLIII